MLIRRMQSGERATLSVHASRRLSSLAIAAIMLASAMSVAVLAIAAEESEDPLARSDIEAGYSEIDKMIVEMQGALATAEAALDNVKTMDVEDRSRAADEFFQTMKDKVHLMLERLGPNSVLMDNLEGAKANVIVFKRWFERQPADFPNRDQRIVQLDTALEEYDSLEAQIAQGRREAQKALTDLSRAQFYRRMEEKVQSVEMSVEMTRRVLTSLKGLGAGIRKVAEQEVPTPIPQ